MDGAPLKQKPSREYRKHGLTILKRAVNSLGNRVIDKRTVTGRALAKWRKDLIADLGGDVSTQQSAIVDLAVKSKVLLDSIDVWLFTQDSLVNKRKKSLISVVKERQSIADGLAKYLQLLGLNRVQKLVDWRTAIQEDDSVNAETTQPTATVKGNDAAD